MVEVVLARDLCSSILRRGLLGRGDWGRRAYPRVTRVSESEAKADRAHRRDRRLLREGHSGQTATDFEWRRDDPCRHRRSSSRTAGGRKGWAVMRRSVAVGISVAWFAVAGG